MTEKIWEEPPMMPNANLQYFYSKFAIIMNYKNDNMIGVIAPTDSRWRMDERFYEEGKFDEAEREKVLIEE